MSDGTPLGFGPPGRYRFPSAINVAFARKGDKMEIAVAVDDGGRACLLEHGPWPTGTRTRVDLAEIAFPGGGSGKASTLTVPLSARSLRLDFLDVAARWLADLSCILDLRAGTLTVPPFSGEGYVLAGPLELGPAGAFGRGHAVTLTGAGGEGLHVIGHFILDDGGRALMVQVSNPTGSQVERELVPRATPGAPAAFSLRLLAEPTLGFVDFLDRKGQPIKELGFVFDFRAGALRPQKESESSLLWRTGSQPDQVASVLCRACRNPKPLGDCHETDALPEKERELVHAQTLPTWDFGFLCGSCYARLLEAEREKQQLSKLATYWVTLGSSVGLLLKAYFGVVQLLLPHGALLHDLVKTMPFLEPRFTLGLTAVLWGFLFTVVPFGAIYRTWVRWLIVAPMGAGPLFIFSLAVQGFAAYWLFRYLGGARVPEFVPIPGTQNPLLWLNFYLYAVVAALANVLVHEFFGQSLRALAERLVRRGPGIAERVNRIFRRFQKLAGLHQEDEIYKTLRELLCEDMRVREYHLLMADEDRQAFVPILSEGRALAEIGPVRVRRGDPNFLGHAGMFGEMYGTHSLRNPELSRVLKRGPLPCEVCVPVKVEGEVRALLNIGSFDGSGYDSDDLAHLSTLSSLLGLALTNAREHRRKDEKLAESQATLEREVTAKEELRSAFAKYVPPALIDRIMMDPQHYLEAEPERAVLTVLFTDLKGFSTVSEQIGNPQELARLLNMYLTQMTDLVFRHWGTLDKYVGDAVVAFFGWPVGYYGDHARRACLAAVEMRDRMADLSVEMGFPDLKVRIGVNTGEMVVGNFGSAVRKSLTVLGDNVNLGARLEPTNKEYGTDVLVTGETLAAAGDAVWAREIDVVRVVGRKTPVVLHEPIAARTLALPDELHGLLADYARGLAAYRARDCSSSAAAFGEALQKVPEDGPSRVMLDRSLKFQASPPGPDWDGVHAVKVK
ncbi:MAG: adenylate/guanylate cyclase domain-containing protein [Candidatus Riflebacteria bacterium]|nr:adenylate/guanylate cyclase domain-containing protein [Candidatus Riflebacteria bacterium]